MRPEAHALEPINVGAVEAARILGISKRTLQTEVGAGRIPSLKIRGRRLFNVDALKRISEQMLAQTR
jgi:excisionase family DNA binding protein